MSRERYEPNRWAHRFYDSIRDRSGMSREDAVERAWAIRERMGMLVGKKAVMVNGLDNPYMSEDARICILNDAMRCGNRHRQATLGECYVRMKVAA